MSTRVIKLFGFVLVLVGLGVSAPRAWAQATNTGSISGTVRDTAGAVIPDAAVTVTNTATTQSVKATTDSVGGFSVPDLPVGIYDVAVEKTGFKKFVDQGVVLHLNDQLTVPVVLETGNVTETVNVTAQATLVEEEGSQLDTVITGEMVRELPNVNRNFIALSQLAPGVSSSSAAIMGFGGLSSSSLSANGGRPTQMNYSIDGTRNVDTGSNDTIFNFPSLDAIAEFNVLTDTYDAQYGRNAGGIINVVTRGGTRSLHGGAYDFLRNTDLDARDPFASSVPTLHYNDFGFNLGGPVYIPPFYKQRDKTFFFYSEEWRRQPQSVVETGTYPTQAQRTQLINSLPGLTGNKIDPNALIILNAFMPLPNAGGNLWEGQAPSPINFRQELLRVDHKFNDKISIWGRYVHDGQSTEEPGGLFTGLAFPGVATTTTFTPAVNIIGALTAVFSPTIVNEVSFDFARNAITSTQIGDGTFANFPNLKIPQAFGGEGNVTGQLPGVSVSGFSTPLAFFTPYHNDNPSYTINDNLTWTKGQHTLKFGGYFSKEAKDEEAGGGFNGSFGFDGSFTQGFCAQPANQAGCAAAGLNLGTFGLADFLQGQAFNYSDGSTNVTVHDRYYTVEYYAQDTWRVKPNFTLTLGLRHSIFLNPYDADNLLDSFLPRLFNPAQAPTVNAAGDVIVGPGQNRFDGLVFAGVNSPYGRYVQTNNYDALSPRIGLAWDPWGDGKTSVRAGFGIYYDRSLVGIVEQNGFLDPLGIQTVNISNPNGIDLLSNPLAGAASNTLTPLPITATGDPFKIPTVNQWSLSVQRELAHNLVAQIAYAGSHGYHLLEQVDINQPLPNVAPAGALNLVRPYRGYASISDRETVANSDYDSLQLSVRKQLSHGLLVMGNYTWAKTLTNASDDRADPAEDSYNLFLDRGLASFQRSQVFNLAFLWYIPTPGSFNGVERQVLGGWEFSGNAYFWSGLPLTITEAGDPLEVGSGNIAAPLRPNLVGDPNGPKTVGEWFNTSAFSAVLPGGNFGTAPKGVVTGPGVNEWDLTFGKNFPIKESVKLRFSADFINAFNHFNGTTVDTGLGDGTFGQVLADRTPRIIQVGLKFLF
ncbi:MAG TPA: carboxypeptidase regulatory-like domain-containing protein [Blastocatellia bacterium]